MKNYPNYLVLSHGRSGSVILAENIGRMVGVLPKFVTAYPPDLQKFPIQHSHHYFDDDQLEEFQVIYNLRRDPVATILSNVLTDHYRQFHKVAGQELMFEPFEFNKWHMINGACEFYCDYHNQYSTQLKTRDLVIFYEDLIPALSTVAQTHVPIYPNKHHLIINYQQVLACIKKAEPALLQSQQKFTQHVNCVDFLSMFDQL